MEVVNSRILAVYEQLRTSQLVSSKDATDTNMNEFKNILKMLTPITQFEKCFSDLVKFFVSLNRASFLHFLQQANLCHLIILTDGFTIANEFGLRGIVSIKWSHHYGKYNVMPHIGGKQPASRSPRQPKAVGRQYDKIPYDGQKKTKSRTIEPMGKEHYTAILNSINDGSKKQTWADICEQANNECTVAQGIEDTTQSKD